MGGPISYSISIYRLIFIILLHITFPPQSQGLGGVWGACPPGLTGLRCPAKPLFEVDPVLAGWTAESLAGTATELPEAVPLWQCSGAASLFK